ncbi:hypothetical protein CWR43_14430 [Rhizobium sullae]|uniref:Uncharacterized protein n=1 Tax=Rhizobium sullae TaxID=50338 RepID=A0A2N0DAW6_RHISU|nr:hypothetical protein [Rhizobium sullae]PKA43236.1 hypothetical protein CWR43_14430 [Rhizobium sullae]
MAGREQLQDFVRHKGPIVVFAGLTFAGMIFIWTSKTFGWSTFLVTAVPICLMLFYFGLAFVANGLRLHNEQAGDNLYYMGFLYTLSSLGVSLYRFTGEASIEDIVRNFGIAVTSTIVGITLRILFNQMRRDPLDIERSVRHELAEMTRRVRTELDSSAREFSSYRRTSGQMLSEGFEEIARQAEKNGEAIQKSIEAVSKEAIRPIQEAAEKLAAIMEANNKIVEGRAKANNELADAALSRLDETSNRLSEIVAAFGSKIEATGNKLASMKLPEEVLKIELQPVLAAITDLSQLQTKRLDEMASQTKDQAEKMMLALQPLDRLPERLDTSLKSLDKLPEAIHAGHRAMDQLPAKIAASFAAFETIGEKIDLALQPMAGVAKKVDEAVGRLEEASVTVRDTTATLSKSVADIVGRESAASAIRSIPSIAPANGFHTDSDHKSDPFRVGSAPSTSTDHSEPIVIRTEPSLVEVPQAVDEPAKGNGARKSWLPW